MNEGKKKTEKLNCEKAKNSIKRKKSPREKNREVKKWEHSVGQGGLAPESPEWVKSGLWTEVPA